MDHAHTKVLHESKLLQAHQTPRQEPPKVDIDAVLAPYNERIAGMKS